MLLLSFSLQNILCIYIVHKKDISISLLHPSTWLDEIEEVFQFAHIWAEKPLAWNFKCHEERFFNKNFVLILPQSIYVSIPTKTASQKVAGKKMQKIKAKNPILVIGVASPDL